MPRTPRAPRRRLFGATLATLATLAVAAALAACGADRITAGDGNGGNGGTSTEEVVVADLAPLTVGASYRLAAKLVRDRKDTIPVSDVAWSTEDPRVATVTDGNLLTAVGVGETVIVAERDGEVGRASLQVTEPPPAAVATVTVTLNSGTIAVAQQTSAAAVLRDAGGNVLTGRVVTWSSSNTAVATVTPDGQLLGLAPGAATITATSEGRSGSATLSVTPPVVASITLAPTVVSMTVGQSATVSATLRDAGGAVITGRAPTWTSASATIATVNGSGSITGVAAGSTQVTASADGVSATVAVTITAVGTPVVSVSPTTATVVAGQSTTLVATMRDAAGNTMPSTFAWTSSNTSVATVNASGVVQGVAPGVASVVATADGRSASATVTVTPVPVASVTLAPSSLSLVVGQSGAIVATCRDAGGAPLPGRTVTWSSAAPGIATVDAVGAVRGVAPGGTTVVATCEGRTASASVTVTAVPVASVTVTPASATVNVGSTLQLSATARDANGNPLTGRTVTWSSSSAATATVSAAGLVTGIAAGTATVTATSEGRSGTATITIGAPPPPSNDYTNEPSGMRFTIDAPFNALTEGGWRPAAAHVDGRFGITSDATAPRSPANVLEFVYPAGFTAGGYSPGTMRAPAPFPDVQGAQNIRELFWAFHFKANAGWQNHSSNINKLGYGWLNDATTFGIVWHWGRTQRPAGDYMKQMAIFIAGTYFMFNTPQAIGVEPGAWYKVEVHLRPSSAAGRADGLVRVWVNGILCADHPNATTLSGFISDVYWSPTWGGTGTVAKAQTDYIRFDHTRISAR